MPEGALAALLRTLSSLIAAAALQSLLFVALGQSPLGLKLWVAQIFSFGLLAWLLRSRTAASPRRLTPAQGLAWGAAFGLTHFFAVVTPLQYLMTQILPSSLVEAYSEQALYFFEADGWSQLAVASAACIAAPLCEELFFRGLVLRQLSSAFKPWLAAALSAVAFAVFHQNPVGALALIALGALFAWLALRTGGLWAPVAAHVAHNSLTTAFFFLGYSRESEAPPAMFGSLILAGWIGWGGLLWLAHRQWASLPLALSSHDTARLPS